jgi:hypothetical protein
MADDTSAASAMQKMDAWFQTLSSDEQQVVAGIINEAFLHAAADYQSTGAGNEVSGYKGYNWPLWIPYTPQYAPNLNNALQAPNVAGGRVSDMGAPSMSDIAQARGIG